MLNFLFLIGGTAFIIYGANWLVDGASAVAKKFGINDLIIGLTIVAFGTSAPELTVNIFSAIKGSTDIAIGNVLGSNISNIFLIVGIAAIIYPIHIQNNTKWKEIPFSLLAIIILGILANDVLIDHAEKNIISKSDGFILLSFLIIFLIYTFGMVKKGNSTLVQEGTIKKLPMWKSLLYIIGGLFGLYIGGKYLVDGAVNIAKILGMSERVIGLTIVAVGTSLPELATSIVAARKKKPDIIIGNVIGSNIFNVFFILGTTATIYPIPFNAQINFDLIIAVLASILLFISTITMGKKIIVRTEGIVFLMIYVSYIIYSVMS